MAKLKDILAFLRERGWSEYPSVRSIHEYRAAIVDSQRRPTCRELLGALVSLPVQEQS